MTLVIKIGNEIKYLHNVDEILLKEDENINEKENESISNMCIECLI